MIEEILPNLYRMEIPLPRNPLRSLNSYLIKGKGRSLIIDTGMNRDECMQVMRSHLVKLEVDLNHTDFFITHMHADHVGLVGNLVSKYSKIYLNSAEAPIFNWLYSDEHWEEIYRAFRSNNFPEEELKEALRVHPGRKYRPKAGLVFSVLSEGESIEVGNYKFECIETPGHSPGHMCLYDAENKVLISGDHLLFDITPIITFSLKTENLLGKYLSSLKKIEMLDVSIVLPGHRSIGSNHHKRIRELEVHHQKRLGEIIHALEDGEKTAFETAPYLSWHIDYSSWDQFPPSQKYFAVAETVAHLQYLENTGTIFRKMVDSNIVFFIPK
ncbi:MBL fold metallo-hydrolase [Chloroflexota bacterium]